MAKGTASEIATIGFWAFALYLFLKIGPDLLSTLSTGLKGAISLPNGASITFDNPTAAQTSWAVNSFGNQNIGPYADGDVYGSAVNFYAPLGDDAQGS